MPRTMLLPLALLLAPLLLRAEEPEEITSVRIGASGLYCSTSITAWRDGNKAWIRETCSLRRFRALLPRDATAELSMAEWNGLVDTIREQKLTAWKPEQHRAFDAATMTLVIQGTNPVSCSWKSLPRMASDTSPDPAAPFRAVEKRLTVLAEGKTRDISAKAAALQEVELAHGCLKVEDRPAQSLVMRRKGKELHIVSREPAGEGQPPVERAFVITEAEWISVAKILYLREMDSLNLKGFAADRPGIDFSGKLMISDGRASEQAWQKRPQDWDLITWLGEQMAAVWVAASKRDVDTKAK